jgi:hypothetical protein
VRSDKEGIAMMETVIVRFVGDTIGESVARALEDFRGMVVTITIQERKPKTKKVESNHGAAKGAVGVVEQESESSKGGSDV